MMIEEGPWEKPCLEDQKFAAFINNPKNYFRQKYGVSRRASKLLSRALDYRPERRIGLSDLRSELLQLSCFIPPQQTNLTYLLGLQALNMPKATKNAEYEEFWLKRAAANLGGAPLDNPSMLRRSQELQVSPAGTYTEASRKKDKTLCLSPNISTSTTHQNKTASKQACIGRFAGVNMSSLLQRSMADTTDGGTNAVKVRVTVVANKERRRSLLDIFRLMESSNILVTSA